MNTNLEKIKVPEPLMVHLLPANTFVPTSKNQKSNTFTILIKQRNESYHPCPWISTKEQKTGIP
jgi:hypothetical protein